MTRKLWVAAVLVLTAIPVAATEELRLRVSPEMSVEPAWIRVHVSVEPDDENRVLEIVAESDEYFRSSRVTLDGARASRTNTVQYRGLPAGTYEVRGSLIGRNGRERAVVRATLVVLR